MISQTKSPVPYQRYQIEKVVSFSINVIHFGKGQFGRAAIILLFGLLLVAFRMREGASIRQLQARFCSTHSHFTRYAEDLHSAMDDW